MFQRFRENFWSWADPLLRLAYGGGGGGGGKNYLAWRMAFTGHISGCYISTWSIARGKLKSDLGNHFERPRNNSCPNRASQKCNCGHTTFNTKVTLFLLGASKDVIWTSVFHEIFTLLAHSYIAPWIYAKVWLWYNLFTQKACAMGRHTAFNELCKN